MRAIKVVVRELIGLFIDDGSLALAIVVLIGAIALLLKTALLAPLVGGVLIFVGLVLILAENLIRSARRLRRK